VLGQASWQHAIDYMRRAVRLDPRRIYHHLDLGEIYIRRKRWAEARAELAAVRALPISDYMDPVYKSEADRLLRQIAGKQ
jgi:regulator of sirC expression with transglutaminase-like and TPR domain